MRPFAVAACLAACVLCLWLNAQSPEGFPAAHMPPGAAQPLIVKACTDCHTLDRVVRARMSPDEWQETLDNMSDKGLTLSDSDLPGVLAYLNANFNPTSPYDVKPGTGDIRLNLNRATAPQLQSMLGITEAQAQAIVAWRDQHGPFTAASGLAGVPALAEVANAAQIASWSPLLAF